MPSSLDDKTGIIVIEDSDDGGLVDRRTLRAQFFSPNRIRSFKQQTPKPVNGKNYNYIYYFNLQFMPTCHLSYNYNVSATLIKLFVEIHKLNLFF